MSRQQQMNLKPCPFCGGKVEMTFSWEVIMEGACKINVWHVQRPSACLVDPIQIKADSLVAAAKIWNKRSVEQHAD